MQNVQTLCPNCMEVFNSLETQLMPDDECPHCLARGEHDEVGPYTLVYYDERLMNISPEDEEEYNLWEEETYLTKHPR